MTSDFLASSPIGLLVTQPQLGIVIILGILLALSIHEAAHAYVADKLGDPTARLMGRTSFNPLVHLDPIGSLLFLFTWFGWGKPVQVNDMQLKKETDIIWVALAGPASNLAQALIYAIIYRVVPIAGVQDVMALFITINLGLMLFNLIPIPPLDGSKILRLFISRQAYFMLQQYGFYLIVIFFLFGGFGLSNLLGNGIYALRHLLIGI
jgi:Zn-dependent protease